MRTEVYQADRTRITTTFSSLLAQAPRRPHKPSCVQFNSGASNVCPRTSTGQRSRLLPGALQVRILPGALAACTHYI